MTGLDAPARQVGLKSGRVLGYDVLSARNPRVIMASVSGFGQDGPKRDNAAYDFMIQAACGLMSVTGTPETAPLRVGHVDPRLRRLPRRGMGPAGA